ncbi:VOC family protein [Microbacterium sp. ET2]|uniref:VOC family protein n=1 Tax=Microbacterium albipurpureum TaxID=3050384 RepID=UPI00259D1714|nr:VOC family protein [Microbacterium sp. ET2 (Ac-2212)]WJL94142.1 VOC family protein [Microbacterium sp. ET2 (Ac-2212)]
MLIVGSIVIRVDDLDAQTAFWTQALDYEVREPRDDDFALLRPRSGTGPNVSLDAVPAPRTLPPRIHLDLYAEDQQAEVARLIALGARVVPWDRMPEDADFVIMEDPEGVRFCVIDARDQLSSTKPA